MIVAIYVRNSRLKEKQIQMCKNHIYTHYENISKFIIYKDADGSGLDSNRPGLNQLLIDAKDRRFNMLICCSASRITRNMIELINIMELLSQHDIIFTTTNDELSSHSLLEKRIDLMFM